MSLPDLVGHYLAVNYPTVLDAFCRAAGIDIPDPAQPPEPDLRTLVEDYVSVQLAQQLTALHTDHEPTNGWASAKDLVKVSLRNDIHLERVKRSIEGISAVNLLSVGVEKLPKRYFDTNTAQYHANYKKTIITSSVDKTLKLVDYETGEVEHLLEPHKATVLCFAVHPTKPRYILSGSMDGTTVLTDLIFHQPLQTFPSTKFVVRVAFSPDGSYFATASYDRHVVLYRASEHSQEPLDGLDETDDQDLACEPRLRYVESHRVKVDSNPEAIALTPEWLLYTLRGSHWLHYVRLGTWETFKKSFNPHPLDTHVSFSVLNLAIHPSGKIIACQTGDRGAERILLYGIDPDETERLACLWTGQDADDYVLPRMAWLPDGAALVVTSSNGYLHLLTLNGEVRSSLKAHGAAGSGASEVVRDVCIVPDGDEWEVVSVGYDRQIKISR